MDPRWEALLYGAAIAIWFFGVVKKDSTRPRLTPTQCALIGWCFFAFPFLWAAAAAGW